VINKSNKRPRPTAPEDKIGLVDMEVEMNDKEAKGINRLAKSVKSDNAEIPMYL
jgi:hypothetical protein